MKENMTSWFGRSHLSKLVLDENGTHWIWDASAMWARTRERGQGLIVSGQHAWSTWSGVSSTTTLSAILQGLIPRLAQEQLSEMTSHQVALEFVRVAEVVAKSIRDVGAVVGVELLLKEQSHSKSLKDVESLTDEGDLDWFLDREDGMKNDDGIEEGLVRLVKALSHGEESLMEETVQRLVIDLLNQRFKSSSSSPPLSTRMKGWDPKREIGIIEDVGSRSIARSRVVPGIAVPVAYDVDGMEGSKVELADRSGHVFLVSGDVILPSETSMKNYVVVEGVEDLHEVTRRSELDLRADIARVSELLQTRAIIAVVATGSVSPGVREAAQAGKGVVILSHVDRTKGLESLSIATENHVWSSLDDLEDAVLEGRPGARVMIEIDRELKTAEDRHGVMFFNIQSHSNGIGDGEGKVFWSIAVSGAHEAVRGMISSRTRRNLSALASVVGEGGGVVAGEGIIEAWTCCWIRSEPPELSHLNQVVTQGWADALEAQFWILGHNLGRSYEETASKWEAYIKSSEKLPDLADVEHWDDARAKLGGWIVAAQTAGSLLL